MNLTFEHDFQQKIMYVSFKEKTEIVSKTDVAQLRSLWMQELKSWHSPYKALIDARKLNIRCEQEIRESFTLMFKFLEGFFLRKAIAYGISVEHGSQYICCKVVETEEQALEELGLRKPKERAGAFDFRSTIVIQNHFLQHTVEVGFVGPVTLKTSEQIDVLKAKLTNNLMQWHSPWSLLWDCTNLDIDEPMIEPFSKMLVYFKGFFLKSTVGYGKSDSKLPFKVLRSRHKAVSLLESEGHFSGDAAHCQSKKTSVT